MAYTSSGTIKLLHYSSSYFPRIGGIPSFIRMAARQTTDVFEHHLVTRNMVRAGVSWEWVEAGAIGTVREIQYWTNRPIWPQAIDRPTEVHHVPPWLDWDLWLGPAPERPYHPAYAPFRWRGWWDYGTGALGDIACHSMDAAFWTLDLGFPTRIVAESTTPYEETAPAASRIEYDFPSKGGRGAIKVVWRDGNLSPPKPEEIGDSQEQALAYGET